MWYSRTEFPQNIARIGSGALRNCPKFTKIVLPKSTVIGEAAVQYHTGTDAIMNVNFIFY